MQLIHPYVQKSRKTILPLRSARWSRRPPVWTQSRLSGNSGDRTAGTGVSFLGIDIRLTARVIWRLHEAR